MRWCASATWFISRRRRFAAVLNRFDWELAQGGNGKDFKRRRTALRFERVFGAKLKERQAKRRGEGAVAALVRFEPDYAPAGRVILTFSGDASIQLQVECIEAELKDLGPAWSTRSKPEHPGTEPGS